MGPCVMTKFAVFSSGSSLFSRPSEHSVRGKVSGHRTRRVKVGKGALTFKKDLLSVCRLYSMWSLVRGSPRCPWSSFFPKMIKYFVKKKNTLNNERYRDLLISILSYDEVSAFLLRVKT